MNSLVHKALFAGGYSSFGGVYRKFPWVNEQSVWRSSTNQLTRSPSDSTDFSVGFEGTELGGHGDLLRLLWGSPPGTYPNQLSKITLVI